MIMVEEMKVIKKAVMIWTCLTEFSHFLTNSMLIYTFFLIISGKICQDDGGT